MLGRMATSEQRAARLLETGLALAAELSLPALLQRIVDLAAELTAARYGALGVVSPDGSGLVDFITTGVGADARAAIGHLPRGEGILGVLIHDATPLRLVNIADDPRSVGFPPDHPPMRAFLGAPIRAHGRVFGNIYLTDKRGASAFTADDEAALVVLATQAGVAIANARVHEEVRMHERWLDAVREVTTMLLAGGAWRAVLQVVAQRAREIAAADLATISVPDGGRLRIVVADGAAAHELVDAEVPLEGSLSSRVIRTRATLRIDDAASSGLSQPMVSAAGVGPMILVPMALRGGSQGVLAVGRKAGGSAFAGTDVPRLESFAEQAALALEYARAQSELARLTMVEDRERIARDLHDGVIQSLFAVGLGLQGMAGVVGDARLADRMQQTVGEIDRVIGDLRGYIFGLRPSALSADGLSNALEQLAHEYQETTGMTVAVDVDASLEAALAGQAVNIAHVVREALSNAGRHSGAATCRVSVRRDRACAVVEVDDDGRGFDVGAAPRGMGLVNLAERAASMAGTLDITSVIGEGTTVTVTLPA